MVVMQAERYAEHTFIITFVEISESIHSVVVAIIECYQAVCNEY